MDPRALTRINTTTNNAALCAEYDALAPQYEIIHAVISARIEQSMMQAELAECAGTKQSNISRFESGNYNLSLKFLQKLAGALGKSFKIRLQ